MIKRLLDEDNEMINSHFPDDTDWNAPTSDSATDNMIAQMEKEEAAISQSGVPRAFANMYL